MTKIKMEADILKNYHTLDELITSNKIKHEDIASKMNHLKIT